MSDIVAQARDIRAAMDNVTAGFDDSTALATLELFPLWKPGAEYNTGDRVRFGGLLYRCVQAHASQAIWAPGAAVS